MSTRSEILSKVRLQEKIPIPIADRVEEVSQAVYGDGSLVVFPLYPGDEPLRGDVIWEHWCRTNSGVFYSEGRSTLWAATEYVELPLYAFGYR